MLSGQLDSFVSPAPPVSENQAPTAHPFQDTPAADGFGEAAVSPWYPGIYTLRIVLTLIAMAVALPVYRTFEFRVSPLAIGVGVAGVALWIGLCRLNLEAPLFAAIETVLPRDWGLDAVGGRAGYNPLEQLGHNRAALIGFLAARFLGLAVIIPIIEEFFLRGFLMRFVMQPDWWKLPIGAASAASWLAVITYAALTHPGELIAAIVWFSLVTLLVTRTKNIWDAITAHAVTNLLLGVWILTSGDWRLW